MTILELVLSLLEHVQSHPEIVDTELTAQTGNRRYTVESVRTNNYNEPVIQIQFVD